MGQNELNLRYYYFIRDSNRDVSNMTTEIDLNIKIDILNISLNKIVLTMK